MSAAAGTAGLATPAHAALAFCNQSSYLLEAASARETPDGWQVRGWVRLDPGACATAIDEPLDATVYYAFARTRPAHGASRRLTSGGRLLCVGSGDFEFVSANGCAQRGLQQVEFARIETDSKTDWTATFTESGEYDLPRARVAGAQRLLRSLGYNKVIIDGVSGGRTTRAIMAFQAENGLPQTGTIDAALFSALEAAAKQHQRRAGFHFCNETDLLVWAAIGYQQAEEWRSSGWLRVPAATCVPALTRALDRPVYYAYAEAVTDGGAVAQRDGAAMIWGGDQAFCTKPTRFFIDGRSNCAARGYEQALFQRVEVSGAEAHIFTLR